MISQFVEPHRSDLTGWARTHRLGSSWGGSEKGSGGSGTVPEPSRPFLLWGRSHPCGVVWPAEYRSTNSRPATAARRSMPLRAPRPLSPPPLPLHDSPQGLTAGRAAKPLARAPFRESEVFFTPGTVAEKKSGFFGCTLTLAPLHRALAGDIRHHGMVSLGFSLASALGAATSVPAALVPAFLLAIGRCAVLPAGSPLPPPACRRTALRAAVSRLGVGGPEELLAPLEQTLPLSRPTSPLTEPRWAASLEWAQGSYELPTAKPRVRSPCHSASRRLLLSSRPSWSTLRTTITTG